MLHSFGLCFHFLLHRCSKWDYYKSTCPAVFDIVRKEMECHVLSDPRNATFIIRLHFHDCFVQGSDGSILLDDTIDLLGEKRASTNGLNSLKGFIIIDKIKNKLKSECPSIFSCADILTIAARDAVVLVDIHYWTRKMPDFFLLIITHLEKQTEKPLQ